MRFAVKVLLIGIFVLGSASVSSTQVPLNAKDNIYATALSVCVAKEVQEYGKLSTRRDYSQVIVERDTFTTAPELIKFGSTNIQYLDSNELRSLYKKSKKAIPILAVRPLQNDNGKLVINVLDYWFSYKKNSYSYALEGGCSVEFAYECETKQFIVSNVTLSGI